MEFYSFRTMYDIDKSVGKRLHGRNNITPHEYYIKHRNIAVSNLSNPSYNKRDAVAAFNQALAELAFIENNRPYYNVYPTMTKYLINLKEDRVPSHLVKLPYNAVAFRFSDTENAFDFRYNNVIYKLKTVFVSYADDNEILNINVHKIGNLKRDIMILWMDFGEILAVEGIEVPVYTYKILQITENKTLEESIEQSKIGAYEGVQIPEDIITKVIKCIASCCLISRDIEDGLIEPDVLSKDRDKYKESRDYKYVDKAIRRGKFGYLVGADLTINPHWRAGCPIALYWTGPGRTVPLYRPRKGAIVHRKKIDSLPTGYGD